MMKILIKCSARVKLQLIGIHLKKPGDTGLVLCDVSADLIMLRHAIYLNKQVTLQRNTMQFQMGILET